MWHVHRPPQTERSSSGHRQNCNDCHDVKGWAERCDKTEQQEAVVYRLIKGLYESRRRFLFSWVSRLLLCSRVMLLKEQQPSSCSSSSSSYLQSSELRWDWVKAFYCLRSSQLLQVSTEFTLLVSVYTQQLSGSLKTFTKWFTPAQDPLARLLILYISGSSASSVIISLEAEDELSF